MAVVFEFDLINELSDDSADTIKSLLIELDAVKSSGVRLPLLL